MDGAPRTHRDMCETAAEAARFLQQRNPGAKIIVTDLRDFPGSALHGGAGYRFERTDYAMVGFPRFAVRVASAVWPEALEAAVSTFPSFDTRINFGPNLEK